MPAQTWLILLQILIAGILVPGVGLLYRIRTNDLAHIQKSLDEIIVRQTVLEGRVSKIEGYMEGQRGSQ
jgi:low affinity Fe/Cu permease